LLLATQIAPLSASEEQLCHAGELNQVALNLIVNAGKGKTITTRQDHESVEIAIHDTGCGIPEKIQPRIFEPFFTTQPVGQGTGQRLALAHATIVRRHGGRLWFESTPGQGTTFFIALPLSTPNRES
jgi:two-component system NtrC family sensor kinase